MKSRFPGNHFRPGSIGVFFSLLTTAFLFPPFFFPVEAQNAPDFPNFIFWEYDYQEALEAAEKEKGIVFAYFYSSGDYDSCQKIERETFSDPGVIQISRGHVFLKLNARTSKALMERYQISKIPTFLLLSHSGQEIYRETTYLSASQFLEKMKSFSPKQSRPNFQREAGLAFYLDYARKAFKHREFFEATKALDYILYKDPNNEQGLNDDVLLLFGTCLVYLYQLEAAEIQFARLCKEYPHSKKVPDAMYILGEIYIQTNRVKLGTGLLEKLIKEYPGHPMARRAQKALERLKQRDKEK